MGDFPLFPKFWVMQLKTSMVKNKFIFQKKGYKIYATVKNDLGFSILSNFYGATCLSGPELGTRNVKEKVPTSDFTVKGLHKPILILYTSPNMHKNTAVSPKFNP